MLLFLDWFGTAVFAITGALVAREKRMDLFGVVVVALVTALGGGTIRDLILQREIFWVVDEIYIWIGVLAAILTFVVAHLNLLPRRPLLIADAFGLSVFTVIGVQTGLASGVTPLIAVIMGVMTATFGGMIRDLLSNRIPLILHSELYATAALCGATVYVLLANASPEWRMLIAATVTLGLRLAAIRWNWSLPVTLAPANV